MPTPMNGLDDVAGLAAVVSALKTAVLAEGSEIAASLAAQHGPLGAGIENLAHYLALRRQDIRPLQRRLTAAGLSSLGRAESRVVETLDAVTAALDRMAGRAVERPFADEASFFAGERLLSAQSEALLGPEGPGRRSRIMVTLPSEAAGDPALVLDLARRGMDVARVNCAHDGVIAWEAMARNVRTANSVLGRPLKILMDIAGPKIRTEAVATVEPARKLARVTSSASSRPARPNSAMARWRRRACRCRRS